MTVHETALRCGASTLAFLAAISSFTPITAFAEAPPKHPLLDGRAALKFHGMLPLAVEKGFTRQEQADLLIGDRVGGFVANPQDGLNPRLETGNSMPEGFKYPKNGYNALVSMTGIVPPIQDMNKPIKVCVEYQGEIRGIYAVDQRTGNVSTEFSSLAKNPDTNETSPFRWACKAALWPYYTELKEEALKAKQRADASAQ